MTEKIWGPKILVPKKCWVWKKIRLQKHLRFKNIFQSKIVLVLKKIGTKRIWVQKVLGLEKFQQNVASKKVKLDKYFGPKKFQVHRIEELGPTKFGIRENWSP